MKSINDYISESKIRKYTCLEYAKENFPDDEVKSEDDAAKLLAKDLDEVFDQGGGEAVAEFFVSLTVDALDNVMKHFDAKKVDKDFWAETILALYSFSKL